MTVSKIQQLKNRFDRLTNGTEDIDPTKLLTDLVGYQKEEFLRSFREPSVQSDQNHQRLMIQLESMIKTLKPDEESEPQPTRRLP